MVQEEKSTPKIFISYSHDNPEHKRWVGELASRLVENGVDVFLDQWDISLGDDLPKFMEKAITESDRVLMICTETYVRKADSGEGGAGYEAMIVTGELVRDLGTSKFIPVIRQKPGSAELPKSVSTRFYINLSENANVEEQFTDLLRELHKAPATTKPKIGKNPFATKPSGEETPAEIHTTERDRFLKIDFSDHTTLYKTAYAIAQEGDIVAWRRIVQQVRTKLPEELIEWRRKYEKEKTPKKKIDLPPMALEGLTVFSPLFCIALTGIESGRKKFHNQISMMDEILFPKDWNRSGLTLITDFPETMAFSFQALHGAVCLLTGQLNLAINMALTSIDSFHSSEPTLLLNQSEIIGWPTSLDGNSKIAWEFLTKLFTDLPWLSNFFSSEEEYLESLCAYYMALNILDFVENIAIGHEDVFSVDLLKLETLPKLRVPLNFLFLDENLKRRAYHLLINDPEEVINIWKNRKIENTKIVKHWDNWMRICQTYLNYEVSFGFRGNITHKKLVEDLLK